MHSCFLKLFRLDTEDTLENLCHLLTIVGKDIDTEESKVGVILHFILSMVMLNTETDDANV